MELNLPKKYLSYSAMTMWLKNKGQYREKYYEGRDSFETVETIFGKKIAKHLEDKTFVSEHPILKTIPRYPVAEQSMIVKIGDVPVMGYLDSFDPEANRFLEYKTGHCDKNGKVPWNAVKVAKHDQLPFYSLLIKTKFGTVDPVCHLVWLETCFQEKTIEFQGHKLTAEGRELELTGKVMIFKRRIAEWERKRQFDLIQKCAKEISEDYTNYLKNK